MASYPTTTWYVYVGNNPDGNGAIKRELINRQVEPSECHLIECADGVKRDLWDVGSLVLAQAFVKLARSNAWPHGIFHKREPHGKVYEWRFHLAKKKPKKEVYHGSRLPAIH